MSDEEYMQKALIEAKEAAKEGEIPVGAIVVAQGRILARTHNLTEMLHDVTAHAEMQAITAAANALGGKYLTGCTLYVTVEPCAMCAGAIINHRIKNVVIGVMESNFGACGSGIDILNNQSLNTKTNVRVSVLEDECKKLLQDFFALKRKK